MTSALDATPDFDFLAWNAGFGWTEDHVVRAQGATTLCGRDVPRGPGVRLARNRMGLRVDDMCRACLSALTAETEPEHPTERDRT